MAAPADAIIVDDDFLQGPDELRRFALEAEYVALTIKAYFPGRNSVARFAVPGLDHAIGDIIGKPIAPVQGTSHGKFRLSLAGETGLAGVHIDNCDWTGVLYLSPGERAESGTDFFRHRPSGTVRAPVYPEDWNDWPFKTPDELWSEVIGPHTLDPSKWELVKRVPMKFNRLVLFQPWQWHDAGQGFGQSVDDGRLIYVMSYNEVRDG